MENSRLTKKIFNNDCKLCKNNSCEETKILFNKLDKIDIFQNKVVCNIDMLMEIYDRIYNNKWKVDQQTKPKLRPCVLFKDSYTTEDYVKYCRSRLDWVLLAQLRIAILSLHVEIGRFRNVSYEERYCKVV